MLEQTTNFSRRKNEHFSALQNNSHPNNKLQSAYNKYGKENFQITKITYEDITKKELDEQEIGRKYFTEWDLQRYTKIKLKEEFTDLIIKYNRGCEPKSS